LNIKIFKAPRTPSTELPPLFVTALWNDKSLGVFDASKQSATIQVIVPAEAQQLGLNRLVLLPHYWMDLSPRAQGLHETERALKIRSIEISGQRPASQGTSTPAIAEGTNIIQNIGTVVSHYAMVPDGAHLSGSFHSTGHATRGQILLTMDGAPAATLFDSASAPDTDTGNKASSIAYDLDLSMHSGRAAGLSFVVTGPDPDSSATWVSPTLHGLHVSNAPSSTNVARNLPVKPNILVVLFDTLRADALEPYGASPGSSPGIKRLSQASTVFGNAFSTAATTRVSVTSLLTGLYPPRHGVTKSEHKLSAALPYLPDLLKSNGYRTVAVIDNPQLSAERGYDRGFDAFNEIYKIDENQLRKDFPNPRERARWTWDTHIAPSLSNRGNKPFFVYLHELDPHFPYQPLPPFGDFRDDGYRGVPLAQPEKMHLLVRFSLTRKVLKLINKGGGRMDDASLDALRGRYAGEVAYMDAYLEWILDHLESTGMRKNTIVVFVSDHGEEFLEHGHFGHSLQVYDPAVRVPLLISTPDHTLPARVENQVELLDLPPTLLAMADIAVPENMQGRNLFTQREVDDSHSDTRPTFAFSDWTNPERDGNGLFPSRQIYIRIGGTKLIRNRYRTPSGTFNTYELYDVANDPDESINLWFSMPVLGHTMRQMLDASEVQDAIAADSIQPTAEPVDEEMLNRLRALGYAE
ncbi:MAG: arylsulfatase A-like enzyme, partial [Myxococcota bacterium]